MTAKEYLRQLSRKDARIDALIERQRRYRELAERRTAVYRDTPGGGRRCSSSVEEYVARSSTSNERSTGASTNTWT